MAITTQTMTREQRKSVALEYLRRIDRGENIFELFADDAQVYFPKWGVAQGRAQIEQLYSDLSHLLASIQHDYPCFNYIIEDDMVVVEGTSSGVTKDGTAFRGGVTHAGRFCDVFEIRDFKIQRCFIYLDPDYAGADVARYHHLASKESSFA